MNPHFKCFVSPTDRTISKLMRIFQAAPVTLDWQSLRMEIGSSFSEVTVLDNMTYGAVAGAMDIWYDAATAASYLILPIFPTSALAKRHEEIGDVWDRHFMPYLVLGQGVVLRRSIRSWLNSIATGLVDRSEVLEFSNEHVDYSEDQMVPHYNFYLDCLARGQMSNQVLLDIDRGLD